MRCPGQDTQYWRPDAIYEVKCPECGKDVEFFKDDTMRRCGHCGHKFVNPKMDFGCASYCKYAEQCIGTLPPEILARQENLLKDRVAIEMKRYFGRDFKRIGHASRVARYAEQIAKIEGGDLAVILSAAYLHDIGIREAERRHGSTGAKYQELEGPPIAREILVKLGAKKEMTEEVCDIIGHHHHPRETETLNFKVLYDADLIENLSDSQKKNPKEEARLKQIIEKSCLTEGGRKVAVQVLMPAN